VEHPEMLAEMAEAHVELQERIIALDDPKLKRDVQQILQRLPTAPVYFDALTGVATHKDPTQTLVEPKARAQKGRLSRSRGGLLLATALALATAMALARSRQR
jgi:hypothetical protein|tara:strand:+ start:347 stop:655 length:309 start_codon:yes stop_codon:yes gene_type:complete